MPNLLTKPTILFDIKNEKFIERSNNVSVLGKNEIIGLDSLFLLNNGNVLIFKASPPLRTTLTEFNPKTLNQESKTYKAPGRWESITKLNNGKILYIGGLLVGSNPYKYQGNVSDKIYVWKRNKE